MKLTERQHEAVAARGTGVLVSASAGSGKTEVLALRCAALIADAEAPCAVDRLLVVTFTRAAAAELKARVARKIRERMRGANGSRRAFLRRQIALLGAADICTIDAWYARLVREHFGESGVDPRFDVLSPDDAAVLRGEVLDDLFEDVYAGREAVLGPPVLDWLGRHRGTDDEFLRGAVLATDAFQSRLVSPEDWRRRARQAHQDGDPRGAARAVLAAGLREELEFQRGELSGAALDAGDEGPIGAYVEQLRSWITSLGRSPPELESVLREIKECPLLKGKKKSGVSDLVAWVRKHWFEKRVRAAWKDAAGLIETAGDASRLGLTLLDLTEAFQSRLARAKRERGVCEFADVQRAALELLSGSGGGVQLAPSPAALALRERYEHVLVDEYQDVSPIQAAALRLVSRGDDGRPGNRFMVGDVKQCIYAFREADPSIIVRQADSFDRGDEPGRVVPLTENFRAHRRLVAAVNGVFGSVFRPELGGVEYDARQRLIASRADCANPSLDAGPRFEVHVLARESQGSAPRVAAATVGGAEPREVVEREAFLVAERIRRMVEGGVAVLDSGAARPALRSLRYSDVAILTRKGVINMALAARTLRREGVPCVTTGREKLLDSVEVGDVRCALKLLVDRGDDIAMAGYLRGPLVGLNERELAAIRDARRSGSFARAVESYAKTGADAALAARVSRAMSQLDRWRVASRTLELAALIQRVMRDGDLELFARGLRAGEHRVETLRALQRFAAEFGRGAGVGEFVWHLDELARREVDPETPVAAAEDAVRVMTIHAAKGLEFPVVFLLGAGAPLHQVGRTPIVRFDEELGLGVSFADLRGKRRIRDVRAFVIGRAAQRKALSEEMRLLYVAATRARELFVVIGHEARDARPADADAWSQAGAGEVMLADGRPSLMSLMQARSYLEWIRLGAAAESEGEPLIRVAFHAALPESEPQGRRGPEPDWTPQDEAWLARARSLLTRPPAVARRGWPAVLAASELKEWVSGAGLAGAGRRRPAGLRKPLQSAPLHGAPAALDLESAGLNGADDGAIRGTACHRFLQHAELHRLDGAGSVRAEAERLAALGRLFPGDVGLVPADDVAWFFAQPEGRRVATGGRVRRELPFVRMLPVEPGQRDSSRTGDDGACILVRGQIDCIVEERDGLTVLDYKTDAIRDAEALRERVELYRPQLAAYGWAASGLLGRPVARLLLVFLRARRVEALEPRMELDWLKRAQPQSSA